MKNKELILFTATIVLLNPFSSSAQDAGIPPKLMHHETLGDKYLSGSYQVSSANKSNSYTELKSRSSSVFTIQVNVDSSGHNIPGDAGNEPNIALSPSNPNNIVIGWRQFDNVNSNFRQAGYSYSSDAGLTWTFPGVIQRGVFRSDPVLDYDSSGNFYYNSLTIDTGGNYFCRVFKSTNGGSSWNNGTNAEGGDKQWMAIDRTTGVGNGNIYSFWTSNYSSCFPGHFTRSTNGDSSYENCTVVDGDPALGTMAIGNAGELYICGDDQAAYGIVVAKSLNAQISGSLITWNAPVSVFLDGNLGYGLSVNPGGLLGQANIDVDRSNGPGRGNVYGLAAVTRLSNADSGDVMFARSTDGGLTWSAPIRVNDDTSVTNTQWFGTMSVAPNGRVDAVWLDTRDKPGSDSSALYYSYSIDQGNTWSVNEKLSGSFDPHRGYPNQNKMGDYYDMISDNTGAHLAWANTLNGEEDVYYTHIIPQIVTSVNEVSDNVILSVFPNPTNGSFFITGAARQLEIYNAIGEKLYSFPAPKTASEINISSQPAGIYFLKIFSHDGSIVTKKIIKE